MLFSLLSSTSWEPGMWSLTPAGLSCPPTQSLYKHLRSTFFMGVPRRCWGTTLTKKDRIALGKLEAEGLQALRHEEALFWGHEGQTKGSKKESLST